jgi:hypothetical protein
MPTASAITAPEAAPAKDYKIPAILLVIGILLYLLWAAFTGGAHAAAGMLIDIPVTLAFKLVIGTVACLLTSKIMGTAFGYVGSALLKLAAVFIFPGAVTLFIPWIGWLVALLLYWGLLEWLFELDALESIVFVIVIWVTSAVAMLLVTAILVAH